MRQAAMAADGPAGKDRLVPRASEVKEPVAIAAHDAQGPAARRAAAGSSQPTGHVIVCGLPTVAVRTVEQLHLSGAEVIVVDDETVSATHRRVVEEWGVPILQRRVSLAETLAAAGLGAAGAVIVLESTDLRTLETVLLVHDLRPDVRLVAHLDNPAVARAVEEISDAVTVLDVASLFAPSVIEACLKRRAHDIVLSATHFVTAEVAAPRSATLRELFGSLVPLGVVGADEQAPLVCPGRDTPVLAGDRVTLLGTREELDQAGLLSRSVVGREVRSAWRRLIGWVRRLVGQAMSDSDRSLRVVVGLALTLLVASTLVLHFGYRTTSGAHDLSMVSALYFTVETIATVGFGDFSFSAQPVWMEIFGICLILAGTTLVTTIFALLTNALVSRRIAMSLGQAQIPGMSGHVVMVGLGAVGMQVLDGLLGRGRQVVVVERDEGNRYLNQVRQLGVPLVLGDSTLGQTLDSVNLSQASSVAIMTSDDMTNIETGLAVRDRLGERWKEVPVVLRVFDSELGSRLEENFDFRHVWSTVAIAAPWFVGAALGLEVLFSFYVGSHPFLIAKLRVEAGGGLEGLAMSELSANIRVIAIARDARRDVLEHPPRRDTRLAAGDDTYLAGPYEELLSVLKRERHGSRPAPRGGASELSPTTTGSPPR
jgi:Trk K+ transport system NAD-binding subunit